MAGRFSIGASVDLGMRSNRFTQGIDRANRGLRRMRGGMRRTQSVTDRLTSTIRRGLTRGIQAATVAAAALGAAAIAALHDIVQVGSDFDRTMQGVASRFTEPIERGSAAFESLEEAAMETGRATEFTASQSADALASLARAGFSAEQAVAALRPTVDLATTAETDLGTAAGMAADALGQWGLMAEDSAQLGANLARVNDVLARASSSANLSVNDLSEAFRDSAPSARRIGVSLEQTTAMIDALAGGGIRGAQAGTALRIAFGRLAAPTSQARGALRRLHVDLEDGEGNVRGMVDILEDLRGATEGMGTARVANDLKQIFGERGGTAAGILLQNLDQVRELTGTLEGAGGAAEAMAASMRDSAAGDIASFESAVEGAKLEAWALIRGPFREITQGFTTWIRENQGAITSAFETVSSAIRDNRDELESVGIFFGVVFGAMAAFVLGMIAVVAVVPIAIAAIGVAAVHAFRWFMDAIRPAVEAVGQFIAGARQGARDFATAVQEFVVGAFVLVRAAIDPYLRPAVEFIRAAAGWAREAWAPVGTFFGALFGVVGERAAETWSRITEGAQTIASRIREVFEPVREFFTDLWESIAGGFMEALGWAVDGVGRLVSNVRAAGRDELDGDRAPPAARPQIVNTTAAAVTESVRETRHNEHVQIDVGTSGGATASVRRGPRARGRVTLNTARAGA